MAYKISFIDFKQDSMLWRQIETAYNEGAE